MQRQWPVNMAGVVCYRDGERPHLFYSLHVYWLRIFQLPAYAPELNPAEGVWSLLRRGLADFVAADLPGLVRIIKRRLKKIQYRAHLLTGCLAQTGLTLDTP